jgi:pimeloyl-ACP methyl ester carboxylesterase
MTPSSRTLSTGSGLDLHALEWNADSDATHTVFLVHGFLDFAWTWQPVVQAWAEHSPAGLTGLHLVAPDMRGHGDSDRIGAGGYYHFLDYLGDLHELVRTLGRQRVSLVGHSMGGSICAYYAGSFPDAISRLAVLEGLGPSEESIDMPKRVRTWLSSWRRARERTPSSYSDAAEAVERIMHHDPRLTRELARELVAHGTRPLSGDGGPDTHRVVFKHDPSHMTAGPYPFQLALAESFWSGVQCPTLYVEGSESSFRHASEQTERRLSRFAGPVQRAVVQGAGHMMQRHRPAAVAELLARFLAAPDPTPPGPAPART